ncbi:MAG: hypothetical protein AAGD25_22455 [Cyanobacteria bacterium P01_F01_bin.150]
MLDLLLMPYPPNLKLNAENEGETFNPNSPKRFSLSTLERPVVTGTINFTGLLIAPPSECAAFYI